MWMIVFGEATIWKIFFINEYSQPSMCRYWRDHRLMEISSFGTKIIWKSLRRDHHSNHEI